MNGEHLDRDHLLQPYLMEHPIFKWLDSRYVQFLAKHAVHETYPAGSLLLESGEEANAFFIIVHGEVQIETPGPLENQPVTLQTLGDGDIVGWSWMVPPLTWLFDVRAVNDTLTVKLDALHIRTRCEEDHDLGFELMKRFSSVVQERLQAYQKKITLGGAEALLSGNP